MNRVAKIRVIAFTIILGVILFSGVRATGYASSPLQESNYISITKTASPTTFNQAGEVINYTITVEFSSTGSFSGVEIEDNFIEENGGSLNCDQTQDRYVRGNQIECTGSYTITETDVENGVVENIATVSATFQAISGSCSCSKPKPYKVSAQDRATVRLEELAAEPEAGILLEKTGSPTTFSGAGEEIEYTYTVSNIGETDVTGPVTVEDNKVDVSCPAGGIAAGNSMECSATYTTTEADVENGSVVNTATAFADIYDSNQAGFEVTFAGVPEISLSKNSDTTFYSVAGNIIRYSFTLTNIGSVPLTTPFSINDPRIDEFRCTLPDMLAVGATFSTDCFGYYSVREADVGSTINNCATASGTYEGVSVTSDEVCTETQYVAPTPPDKPEQEQSACEKYGQASEECTCELYPEDCTLDN